MELIKSTHQDKSIRDYICNDNIMIGMDIERYFMLHDNIVIKYGIVPIYKDDVGYYNRLLG